MTDYHGFELIQERDITEINSKARLFRHQRTGAELLSIENTDENKTFGVAFKTPPDDSTGLPHIMEHSVLGGSRKYPLKEPLNELVKGSLNTFINAMTFPDMTLYPVASTNTQDFYNLVDVYMDAVFYPLLTEQKLQREGWRYDLEDMDAPLTYKGVVFNEMKGAYSSPDGLVYRYVRQELMPDTPMGFDSGGDPVVMPDLTYEKFKHFYDTRYHPSNARFFFYGDDDPEERLRLVDDFIQEFDGIELEPDSGLQPRFDAPRTAVKTYDAGDDADEDAPKTMISVSWLLTEARNVEELIELQILEQILVESSASPLRQALIESGLGEDLIGGGLSAWQREIYFSTGLKGVRRSQAEQVEALILETLGNLAEEGIDQETVEASLNTIEFQLRELNFGQMPRGLFLMMFSMPAWMYGGDPLETIAFEDKLEQVKARLAEDSSYFEQMIGKYFLDNPHRSTVVLAPEDGVNRKLEEAERERLARIRSEMDESDLKKVIEDATALEKILDAPDSPEALASIPRLQLEDLDKEIKTTPSASLDTAGTRTLYHDLPTNGIVYLDLAFDLKALPADLLPFTQLFGQALLEIGTESQDYIRLSQRIGRYTGGIESETISEALKGEPGSATWLVLRGKAMAPQADDLLAILRDVLLTVNLDNKERFRQVVLEEKNNVESMLVPAGHMASMGRLRSQLDEAGWVTGQIEGIDYLFFLRDLVEQIDNDWAGVLQKLEQVRKLLVNRDAMLVNVTVEDTVWDGLQSSLSDFLLALPKTDFVKQVWTPAFTPINEGLMIPAQVNYVSMGGNLFDVGYQLHGSHIAVRRYLGLSWLWDNIRLKGGAYGGFCRFDPLSGTFMYASYRDPNLLQSVDVYLQAGQFLRDVSLSDNERTKIIIGAISDLDTYLLPDAKGYRSMVQQMVGVTDAMRQQTRDEVLSMTVADLQTFGEALIRLNDQAKVVVVGSPDDIEAANKERGGDWLKLTQVL